jgi:hypothetical protein
MQQTTVRTVYCYVEKYHDNGGSAYGTLDANSVLKPVLIQLYILMPAR